MSWYDILFHDVTFTSLISVLGFGVFLTILLNSMLSNPQTSAWKRAYIFMMHVLALSAGISIVAEAAVRLLKTYVVI